jgi:hypothetical protein
MPESQTSQPSFDRASHLAQIEEKVLLAEGVLPPRLTRYVFMGLALLCMGAAAAYYFSGAGGLGLAFLSWILVVFLSVFVLRFLEVTILKFLIQRRYEDAHQLDALLATYIPFEQELFARFRNQVLREGGYRSGTVKAWIAEEKASVSELAAQVRSEAATEAFYKTSLLFEAERAQRAKDAEQSGA